MPENALIPTPPEQDMSSITKIEKIHKRLEEMTEAALEVRVDSADALAFAASTAEGLREFIDTLDSLVEVFRKPAYDHYKQVLAAKKKLLDGPQAALAHLRDEMAAWKKKVDEITYEARLALSEGRADDEQVALVRSDGVDAEVDGVEYRTYWKAELEREGLKKLCRAIADGKAPVTLVTFNQSEANRLARSLRDVMDIPGVSVYVEKVPVIRR